MIKIYFNINKFENWLNILEIIRLERYKKSPLFWKIPILGLFKEQLIFGSSSYSVQNQNWLTLSRSLIIKFRLKLNDKLGLSSILVKIIFVGNFFQCQISINHKTEILIFPQWFHYKIKDFNWRHLQGWL